MTARTRRQSRALDWRLSNAGTFAEQEAWRVSSAHLQAVYPAMASPGLGTEGILVGRDLYGSAFVFDPWVLYGRQQVANANILILGDTGFGKSGLIKRLLYRGHVRGHRCELTDVKDEYGPLVDAIGGTTISLYRGGSIRLNPLRPNPDGTPADELLRGVAGAALGRDLLPAEAAGLDAAVAHITTAAQATGREPIIPELVDELLEPSRQLVDQLRGRDTEEVRGELRQLGLALQTLCRGPLSGMFDAPSTADIDWRAPGVRLDLSRIQDDTALAVLMVAWMAFLRQAHEERRAECAQTGVAMPPTWRPNDETWRAAAVPGVAATYQREHKLARSSGVANISAIHKLADLESGTDTGTAASKQLAGLVDDIDIQIIFRITGRDVTEAVCDRFGLSETLRVSFGRLRQDQAFWIVGGRQFLVQHETTTSERAITYTDAAMDAAIDSQEAA